MRLEIKSLHLENFKGCKDRKVEFDGNTKVFGANSAGKSSLFCAWLWLMSGVNEHLVSNPNITPLGESECESIVTAEITIDGQFCTISKSQKFKEKYDANSEKTISSTVNSYTINGVDKSATAFMAEMKERGVDMNNFLMLSHVFAFTADTSKKGREEMRKTLFEMVKDISDLDIAKEVPGITELTIELGKGYKLEEVEQMAKQSLKKINDNYGKSGELIDARINGMLESKAEVNTDGIVERELETKKEIRQAEERINLLNAKSSDTEIAKIQLEIELAKSMAKESYFAEKEAFIEKRNELSGKYREIEDVIAKANKTISDCEYDLNIFDTTLEDLRKDYEKEFAKQFEGNTECPVCHRPLPEEMVNEAKAQFEQYKATNIANIKEAAERVNKNIDSRTQEMNDARETINRVTPSLEMLKGQLNELEKEPVIEPVYDNLPDVVALQDQINRIKQKADDSSDKELESLNEALRSLRNELSEIEGTYKVLENNKAIDSKVTELREQKRDSEIQRSVHEKMIYEIETFKKYKNNKLSENINSHFKVAQFRLYKVLKNGSIEDDCAVLVNGKEMTTQLNQAMQIRAMLDIINGISAFKQIWFPVFIDDASLLTEESIKAIDMQNQLIWLFAKDGYTELTVERS